MARKKIILKLIRIMNLEYNNCPICGAVRNNNESTCPSCGFVYIPIDKENSKDISYIERWQKEHKIRPRWIFGVAGLSVVGLIISPFLYDEYSYDQTALIIALIISISALLFSILYIAMPPKSTKYMVNRREIIENAEKEALEKQRMEKIEKLKAESIERTNSIIAKYGEPTKVYYYFNFRKGVGLRINDNFHTFGSDNIAIFAKSQYMMVGDKFYPFSSIIGHRLVDNKRIIHGEQISVTSTKPSDALMTSLFAMTNDTEWTIASAGNARKETVTYKDDDREGHEFTLYINIDNISEPIIKIPIGRSVDIAQELDGLMNVIIQKNLKS